MLLNGLAVTSTWTTRARPGPAQGHDRVTLRSGALQKPISGTVQTISIPCEPGEDWTTTLREVSGMPVARPPRGPVRWSDVRGRPAWGWGKVEALGPLKVSFAAPLLPEELVDPDMSTWVQADSLVAGLAVGDRVWCQTVEGAVIVYGKTGG